MDEVYVALFERNSTRVALNGLWLKRGAVFDYVETEDGKIILNDAMLPGDSLTIEFVKQ